MGACGSGEKEEKAAPQQQKQPETVAPEEPVIEEKTVKYIEKSLRLGATAEDIRSLSHATQDCVDDLMIAQEEIWGPAAKYPGHGVGWSGWYSIMQEPHVQKMFQFCSTGAEGLARRLFGQSVELMKACTAGDVETVKGLLADNKYLVNSQDSLELTALHHAADMGQVRGQKAVDAQQRWFSPYLQLVRALLSAGADANATTKDYHRTALHYAAHHNHPEMIKALLEAGADKSLVDTRRQTAMDVAKSAGHLEVAELLKQSENEDSE
eukprot:TRINITY_DN14547_c0_g1_i1.p1 TRINITY_DN14547_c0_g1~~TRINITY_DN14547_c0_g1_i1.p1  ORF type:complete len:267 (-),score=86.52 TRINITY_DN14547_c0_g1_i1:159-959(-)